MARFAYFAEATLDGGTGECKNDSESQTVMPVIDVGKKAPLFTLADQAGEKHALKDSLGSPVILYFYPKDDTSGCTNEAQQFRDLLPKFNKAKAKVIGVSPDDVASHAKFAEKYDLTFTLLADPGSKICNKYGVWVEKSMYGNKYMGVVRTTYLIDPKGRVAQRWDKVKVTGHAQKVLEAVQSL